MRSREGDINNWKFGYLYELLKPFHAELGMTPEPMIGGDFPVPWKRK